MEAEETVLELTKDRSRAVNRHHRYRLRNVRKHYHSVGDGSKRAIGIVTTTPCVCSCEMCANPRHYERKPKYQLTHQELRDRINVREQLREV